MLRGCTWRNKSQLSLCAACQRALWQRRRLVGQARAYSDHDRFNAAGSSPASPPKSPAFGNQLGPSSSWGSSAPAATTGKLPGAASAGGWGTGPSPSLIRRNIEPTLVSGLLPHERRAREEAAKAQEEGRRRAAEAARARAEADRARREKARLERLERDEARRSRPPPPPRLEQRVPPRPPFRDRYADADPAQPGSFESLFESRFESHERQPQPIRDDNQEWGHIRRRVPRSLPFDKPTRNRRPYDNDRQNNWGWTDEPSGRYNDAPTLLDFDMATRDSPRHFGQRRDRFTDYNTVPQQTETPASQTPDEVWTLVQNRMKLDEDIVGTTEETSGYTTNPNFSRSLESKNEPRDDDSRRASERKEYERARKPKNTRYNSREDDDFDEEAYEERKRRRAAEKERKKKEQELAAAEAGAIPIFLPEYISVSNLGEALGVKLNEFLRQLEDLGFEDITAESIMTGETAALVAQEYGFEPTVDSGEKVDLKPRPPPEDPSVLPPRPPVVTIMGHVDHGKTTLLDYLRKSSVAASEHGGITQHIGAFSVKLSSGKQITFLDTPGHAAFLSMRQRGANVTDIVILVVAADDSVKPQTIEALKHARAANVPIIVAINKVDKEEARVDLVKSDLAKNGVEIEDYGGDVQTVLVSGRTGQGMQDLEESILSLSEVLDLRAEQDGMAEGWVLESSVKSIGRAATVLVKRGTLRKGDYIVAGKVFAKIRVMLSEGGVEIEEAPPGTPVEILGWRDLPDAGDQVLQAPDEDKAKNAIDYRRELSERGEAVSQMAQQELERREREREKAEKAAAEAEADHVEEAEDGPPGSTTVHFLVRGDVDGSVEAVCASIMEIGNNEVRPKILRAGPGLILESDIEYASISGSHIVNFNNPIPGHIKRMAEESGVRILDFNVIYHLVDAVKDTLSQQLKPTISTKVLGEAEVLQLFPINIRGRVYKNIAGCRIRNGLISRNAKYRVIRKGEKVYDGVLDSLKHGKKDVSEMRKGSECGISFEGWDELQQGDQIQAYEEITEKRYL